MHLGKPARWNFTREGGVDGPQGAHGDMKRALMLGGGSLGVSGTLGRRADDVMQGCGADRGEVRSWGRGCAIGADRGRKSRKIRQASIEGSRWTIPRFERCVHMYNLFSESFYGVLDRARLARSYETLGREALQKNQLSWQSICRV